MTSFSIEKNYLPNEQEKSKMIKLIKNKLTPLSETQKYPMGKISFLNFKNLQKMPKLKKQHFNFKSRKSQNQEAIMNDLMTQQLYKSDKKLSDQIYKRPNTWLKLWKKTGDAFQNSYLTNRQNNHCNLFFPVQNQYTQQLQTTKRFRNSQHDNLTKLTQVVLKKVQIFKQKKKQQMQNRKKIKLKDRKSQKLRKSVKQAQLEGDKHTQRQENQRIHGNQQNQNCKNDKWVLFISDLILNKHINKNDQQNFFEQFVKRKDQNKIRQFIDEFQTDKRTFRSCHVQRNSYKFDLSEVQKQQKYAKRDNQNQKSRKVSPFQQQKGQFLSCNNPTIRLRRLKSKCKSIQSQVDPSQKQNTPHYNCNKVRMHSNHKKMIQTMKFLGKA